MQVSDVTQRVDIASKNFVPRALRYLAALLWLANVNWKVPPDFGRGPGNCSALCRYVEAGIDHPVLPGSAWFFETVVSPNLSAFGWLTLFVEATLVVLLLSGRFVRVAAVLGILQSLAIGAAVANAPGEWYWSYILMATLHVAILATTPHEPFPSARLMAWITIGYGVAVGIVHAGAGLDGSGDWHLFSQDNSFPGEWGRGSFPGSIAIGMIMVALGLVGWWVAGNLAEMQRRVVGWVLVAAAVLVLLTYGADGLIIDVGSRPGNLCVVAALGLALAIEKRGRSEGPAV